MANEAAIAHKCGVLKIGNAHSAAFENAPKTAQTHPKPKRFLPQTVGLPGVSRRRQGWAPEARMDRGASVIILFARFWDSLGLLPHMWPAPSA